MHGELLITRNSLSLENLDPQINIIMLWGRYTDGDIHMCEIPGLMKEHPEVVEYGHALSGKKW